MRDEEIKEIERIVNQKITEGIQLDEKRDFPFDEAVKLGAMALFGEKYSETVRVITFDPDFSVELCGGTHVVNTSEIGLFKIVTETSVAAGVRRIEAFTGNKALTYFQEKEATLNQVSDLLKSPKNILKSLETLIQEKNDLQKQIDELNKLKGQELKKSLESKVFNKDGLNYLIEKVESPDTDTIKQIAFEFRNKIDNLVLVLGAVASNKPSISIMFSDNLVADKDLHAGNMVRVLAKEIQGGGGGQAFFATAGGKKVEGLDSALSKAKELLELV